MFIKLNTEKFNVFEQTKTDPNGNNEISELKGVIVLNISRADEIIFRNEDVYFFDADGTYTRSYNQFYDLSKLKKYVRDDNTFKVDQSGNTLYVDVVSMEQNKKAIKIEKQYYEIEKDGKFESVYLAEGKYFIDYNADKPRLLKADVAYTESESGDYVFINEGYTKIPVERFRCANYNILEIVVKRSNRNKQGISVANKFIISKYLFDPSGEDSKKEYDRIKSTLLGGLID